MPACPARRSRLSRAALCALYGLGGLAGGMPGGAAQAQPAAPSESPPAAIQTLAQAAPLPVELSAHRLRSTLGGETLAQGEVLLRQGSLALSAEVLRHHAQTGWVRASGPVQLQRLGDRFSGESAEIHLDSRLGSITRPSYYFARTGAGGHAERIDFIGERKLSALRADYTSCPRPDRPGATPAEPATPLGKMAADPAARPDWLLSADRLDLDFERNEGIAQGAVLEFLGVPILAAPAISFPATGERKSGWLPPELDSDTRGGLGLSVPYYWNLAPNYDLTTTAAVASRRGFAAAAELRYLQPSDEGALAVHLVPDDQVAPAGKEFRHSFDLRHSGTLLQNWRYQARVMRASDNEYWKDFPSQLPSLTRRLLPQAAALERRWWLGQDQQLDLYARVQGWQVLQDEEAIAPPYQRLPQLGLHGQGRLGGDSGLDLRWGLIAEANRFELADTLTDESRSDGSRLHATAAVHRPFDAGWGWLTPRLAVNAASYRTDLPMADGRLSAQRLIPTLSADAGLRLDRASGLFGLDLRQTLEPRLHYVNTPWRNQTSLPLFDTAASDFNAVSIYADNPFSGIDRIADTHQVTLGATSRWVEQANGAERLRLGLAQRFLLRDQRLTPEGVEGDKRVSDLLLFGSGSLFQDWVFDTSVQYNAAIDRTVRSIVSARWQPEPFHTLSGTYRYARGLSEQFELGWQWPLYRGQTRSNGCGGSLYGVGRVNFSMRENRVTDSLAGLEYDAGCWIGRFVLQKVSTSLDQSTTRWMLQLELIGLSRLGSNPLKVLKDNIPGYRLLREDDDSR